MVRYRAELLLPINSPVKKPIVLETPVDSKKLAQMAVALEVGRFGLFYINGLFMKVTSRRVGLYTKRES